MADEPMTEARALGEFRLWLRHVGEYNPRPVTLKTWLIYNAPHLEPRWLELWDSMRGE